MWSTQEGGWSDRQPLSFSLGLEELGHLEPGEEQAKEVGLLFSNTARIVIWKTGGYEQFEVACFGSLQEPMVGENCKRYQFDRRNNVKSYWMQ